MKPHRGRGSWGGGRLPGERAKQLGDQERWLEEKKRQAEAKLAAKEEEKAAEKRAASALQSGAPGGKKTALGKFSAARFGLKGKMGAGVEMVATCAEKKAAPPPPSAVPAEPQLLDGLFVNDGNFMAKFYQMQGQEPPPATALKKEPTEPEERRVKPEATTKVEPLIKAEPGGKVEPGVKMEPTFFAKSNAIVDLETGKPKSKSEDVRKETPFGCQA